MTYFAHKIQESINRTKEAWNIINKELGQKQDSKVIVLEQNGSLISDPG